MTKNQMKISDLDGQMAPLAGTQTPLIWRGPEQPPFRLTGFPWYETDHVFRRLAVNAGPGIPDAVNNLANCTAGGQVSFQSDTRHVAVRVELTGAADMPHMPATGECGFDLYIGAPCAQRFRNTAKYDHHKTSYELLLFQHPDAVLRNFTLNFPLYSGVKSLAIGLTPQARLEPPLPWSIPGRIVFYGTSITQGGCASRPGMAYTNILSRALNVEIVNLGFSGSARGEPDVIECVASIPNPALFVLDYEANSVGYDTFRQTLPVAVSVIRRKHERVPLLIVSRIAFAGDVTHLDSREERERCRSMQKNLVETLRRDGDAHIHFCDGITLLGSDFDECTVDGIHPNDLGFMQMARALEPVVRKILPV